MNDTGEALKRAGDLMQSGRAQLTDAARLMRAQLPGITNARVRGTLNQRIWICDRALAEEWPYFSQCGQDAWLDRNVFKGRAGGVFAEIGGYNGIGGSNTLFFEMRRGWSGLLAEPSPRLHAAAQAVRRCACVQVAAADSTGEAEFLDIEAGFTQMGGLVESYDPKLRQTVEADPRHKGTVIRVPTRPLADILDGAGLREIDYVSLDVEGGELAVLSAFPFERFRVTAWTVENNTNRVEIPELMRAKGYRMVEALGMDEVYLLNET